MSVETRDAWGEKKDAESNRKSGSVLSIPCFKIELSPIMVCCVNIFGYGKLFNVVVFL
jgi:hypothetical protein